MNFKKTKFNRFVITPLWLMIHVGSDKFPIKAAYNEQTALKYTFDEVLPHYLHLLLDEDIFKDYVGDELYQKLQKIDPVDQVINRIDLVSDMWDEMMRNAEPVWGFTSPGFFRKYVLSKGLKLNDNQILIWENDTNGLIGSN